MSDTLKKIDELVKNNPIVLFMKGTPQFPMCGFSGKAVNILKQCGITDFIAVNVLDDNSIREGIKTYSNWPTIPQLYIDGEFIGGSDIMAELFESGELQKTLTL